MEKMKAVEVEQMGEWKSLQSQQGDLKDKLDKAEKAKDRAESARVIEAMREAEINQQKVFRAWEAKNAELRKQLEDAKAKDEMSKAVYQNELADVEKKEDALLAAHGLDLNSSDPVVVERVNALAGFAPSS